MGVQGAKVKKKKKKKRKYVEIIRTMKVQGAKTRK